MMIMWQFENAFQNLGEYFENPRFFLVFRATEWDQSSVIAKRVCVAFLLADKTTRQVEVIRNITVLWGIMLLLSRHNQNPP